MKIKRMDEKSIVVFDDITPGTVFGFENEIYMKTTDSVTKPINAVRLTDGATTTFIGYAEITRLDAELVIK